MKWSRYIAVFNDRPVCPLMPPSPDTSLEEGSASRPCFSSSSFPASELHEPPASIRVARGPHVALQKPHAPHHLGLPSTCPARRHLLSCFQARLRRGTIENGGGLQGPSGGRVTFCVLCLLAVDLILSFSLPIFSLRPRYLPFLLL